MTYNTNFSFIILLILNLTFNSVCEETEGQEKKNELPEEKVPDYPPYPKKGLGIVTKHAGWNSKLEKLNVSWHYSWGYELKDIQPDSIEFVPMIWGAWSDNVAVQIKHDEIVHNKDEGKVDYLLGFNESDNKDQANMPFERTLAYWPKLMDAGLPLGSPGCVHANREWMQEFMSEIEKRNYRVDFVCVHWYGGANAQTFVDY